MARQKGIIKLKGKIGDLSFYKTQDGHLAREKGGVDASRIANDPAFIRTAHHLTQTGEGGKFGPWQNIEQPVNGTAGRKGFELF